MKWYWNTRKGTVWIVPRQDLGSIRYHVVYDDEALGSYHSPQQAADDVAGGHTFGPSNGVDLGSLGISNNIADWQHTN
ncbi:hypothetical protein SAMN06265338_104203 [Rhodoblastus acidophilus]|uniref:DUF2188 domain-containing protein n=1 Tax=Rhodoblastus acidophilus TaxID=1074 RepID=A0A212RHM9_RHOAC|nr:hypothetical protein [Rhodoblastus acidophilus]SNB71722.1 hypothetical protein SAMN06265338_104203 [Rhodoblastus acidophilus]